MNVHFYDLYLNSIYHVKLIVPKNEIVIKEAP